MGLTRAWVIAPHTPRTCSRRPSRSIRYLRRQRSPAQTDADSRHRKRLSTSGMRSPAAQRMIPTRRRAMPATSPDVEAAPPCLEREIKAPQNHHSSAHSSHSYLSARLQARTTMVIISKMTRASPMRISSRPKSVQQRPVMEAVSSPPIPCPACPCPHDASLCTRCC